MYTINSRYRFGAAILPAALLCAFASSSHAGEWSANASMTSNYIWRGLTQTENEAAVQGGIDYAADNGFYIGTWASNVNYGAGEAPGQDFGFGEAYYLSLDYGFELSNGVWIGLHIGHHDGDFAEAFNGNAEGYYDYNVSISKGGFTFMISDTDVKGGAAEGGYDNDQMKFVVSYAVDIAM